MPSGSEFNESASTAAIDNTPQMPPACSDEATTPTTTPAPTPCPIPVCSYTNPDVDAILVHCNQPHVPCPRWGCPVRTTTKLLKHHLRTSHLGDEKSIQNYPPIELTPFDLETLDWIFVRNGGSWEGTAQLVQLFLPHLDYRRVGRLVQEMSPRFLRLDIEKCNAALDERVKMLHEMGYMPTEEEVQERYFGRHPPAGCTPNTIPSSSTSGTP